MVFWAREGVKDEEQDTSCDLIKPDHSIDLRVRSIEKRVDIMQRNKICNKNEGMQSQRIKDLGLALRNVNSYREKRTQILQLKKKICQKVNRESRFVRPQKKRGGKSISRKWGICVKCNRKMKKNEIGEKGHCTWQ